MRNVLIVLAMLAGGCVFQESPEIPVDGNNNPNNFTNNLLNNLTNNVLNNVLNNLTNNLTNNSPNNAPNNATNNTTNSSTNNTALPDCSPQPEFCYGYFQCSSGTTDDLEGNPCRYDCGTCPADAQCISELELCSSQSPIMLPTSQGPFIKDLASSRKDIFVWWSDDSLSLLLPDGTQPILNFNDVELDPNTPITAISSTATRWVAIGQADSPRVTIAERGGKFSTIQGMPGSQFGISIALAYAEKSSPLGPADYGMGVVGEPGANDAKVIARTPTADWDVVQSLVELLPDPPPSAFGNRVAISPQGRTILVNSSNGAEAFRLVNAVWEYDNLIPNPGQARFGAHVAVGETVAVVASERFLNVLSISNQDRVRIDAVEVIKTGDDSEILDLEVLSGVAGSTVIFALVKSQGNTSIQMWQRGAKSWFLSNTVSPANINYDTLDVLEASFFDQPSVFPAFTVSGSRNNLSETRIFPLVLSN
jgi:hypothetical protein